MARGSAENTVPFEKQLVLQDWFLAQVDLKSVPDATLLLADAESEPWVATPTPYAVALRAKWLPGFSTRTEHELFAADARIFDVTAEMNEHRDQPIQWKYFQYLALLFADLYFDDLLRDREGLRVLLNTHLSTFNERLGLALPPWSIDATTGLDDLDSLAFWMATGAGKTLLFHGHVRLYRLARERHGLPNHAATLLLTPYRGLSLQHVRECAASGLQAEVFEKQAQVTTQSAIQVLEFTRFRDDPGPDTVHTDWFNANRGNLVCVDEGHRGVSEDSKWRKTRQKLALNGFVLEYSATLKHAAGKPKDALWTYYVRSIAIDYSYKRFHADSYGKHFRILNLPQKNDEEALRQYLSAALLVFFQQVHVFATHKDLAVEYAIERPLCIFVGATVTGRKTNDDEKPELTDIVRLLNFLGRFLKNDGGETERILDDLLHQRSPLITKDGHDPFGRAFLELPTVADPGQQTWSGASAFQAMRSRLFNAQGGGTLHVQDLKETQGELALHVGENEPFAVISVGDTSGLKKLLDEDKSNYFQIDAKSFGRSLFHRLDERNSPISFLFGSRKFTEGWSSWRVSLIGLLNLGKNPGTQVIQLFGRGVRLRGKDGSLKRSSKLSDKPGTPLGRLFVLEQLSVFGIDAKYIEEFQKELEKNDVEEDAAKPASEPLTVKIARLREEVPKVQVLCVPATQAFTRDGENLVLAWDSLAADVTVHAWPRIEFTATTGTEGVLSGEVETHTGPDQLRCFALLDHDALYRELWNFKARRGWSRLMLPRQVDGQPLSSWLLRQEHGLWLNLEIPGRLLDPATLAQHRQLWQQLAAEGLRQYVQNWYELQVRRWKTKRSTLAWLHELPPAEQEKYLPNQYTLTPQSDDVVLLAGMVTLIRAFDVAVRAGRSQSRNEGDLGMYVGKSHMWWPLLYATKQKDALKVRVTKSSPVVLNRDEFEFVDAFETWLDKNPAHLVGAEVHLLRNEARTGMGLFDKRGFYPDFVLWITLNGIQRLTFIDPKGLVHLTSASDNVKVRAFEVLQTVQAELQDPAIRLDAWIVSTTPLLNAPVSLGQPSFEANHIVFLEQAGAFDMITGRQASQLA
jgi:hypothetical protein